MLRLRHSYRTIEAEHGAGNNNEPLGDKKARTVDLHQVRIGNVLATKLAQPDLYRALQQIVPPVPGIESHMGWSELALRAGIHQQILQEADNA